MVLNRMEGFDEFPGRRWDTWVVLHMSGVPGILIKTVSWQIFYEMNIFEKAKVPNMFHTLSRTKHFILHLYT